MNLFTIRTQTALALVVAASLPQVAQSASPTGSAASHYSPAALQAMGARYDAMAKSYAARPAASYLSAAAVQAMGQRYQAQVAAADSTTTGYVVGGQLVRQGQVFEPVGQVAGPTDKPVRPDDRGGIRGIDDAPLAAAASSGSFDWTDAGIGALGGLGVSLLLVGGLVLGLSTRRERKVAPV
jgi:hypothetical protein